MCVCVCALVEGACGWTIGLAQCATTTGKQINKRRESQVEDVALQTRHRPFFNWYISIGSPLGYLFSCLFAVALALCLASSEGREGEERSNRG